MAEHVDAQVMDRQNDELVRVEPEEILYVDSKDAHTLIVSYTDRLNNFYKKLKTEYSPYNHEWIFSGDTKFSDRPGRKGCPNIDPLIWKEYRYPYETHDINLNGSNARPLNTGVDVGYLRDKYPNGRWKFYLSLDTTTTEQNNNAMSFLRELVERCKQQKVSLMIKTEEHDYDQPDLFTWQPVTMGKILQELHSDERFSGIWFNALRFFQKGIGGKVPVSHIGMVQEPIGGVPIKNDDCSHSYRMMHLGRSLDKTIANMHNGGRIGTLNYLSAARGAGVEPSQPWRVDRNLLKTLNQPKVV
jgi:hypothetical protein